MLKLSNNPSLGFDGTFIHESPSGISQDSIEIFNNFEKYSSSLILYTKNRQKLPSEINIAKNKAITKFKKKILTGIIKNKSHIIPINEDYAWNSHLWGVMLEGQKSTYVRLHDTFPITNPEWFPKKSQKIYRVGLNALLNSNYIGVANSFTTKKMFQNVGLLNEIRVLYCGAKSNEDRMCTFCIVCKGEVKLDREFAIAIGTIEPRKNYTHLISNWTDSTSLKLVICGKDGWFRSYNNEIKAMVSKNSNISLVSEICETGKRILLEKSLFLIGASYAEGFNIPAMEARRLNKPLLLSKCEVNLELHSDYAQFYNENYVKFANLIKITSEKIPDIKSNIEHLWTFDKERDLQIKNIFE